MTPCLTANVNNLLFLMKLQVTEPYNPFHNESLAVFVIGSEKNCENQEGFCNGPLKSGTSYWVKVRAFTSPHKYTDTGFSEPFVTGENCIYVLI